MNMKEKLICSASIEYTPKNLRELNKVINNTFKLTRKIIYILFCVALMAYGASLGLNNTRGLMLICAGCFLLPSLKAIENSRLNALIKRLNGKIIKVKYSFYEDFFTCWDEKETSRFNYNSIIKVVRRRRNFYMFPNENQAYMINLDTLENMNEEKFIDFINEKIIRKKKK